MATLDIDLLTRLADTLIAGANLTPSERAEVLRIAQGLASKDSAASANISPETIRARRKRVYRKLGAAGAPEIISRLLGAALQQLSRAGASAAAPNPTREEHPERTGPGHAR